MKKKKKENTEEIIEPEELEIQDKEIEPDENREEILSPVEKIQILSAVIISFIFFLLIFMPYGLVFKKSFNAFSKTTVLEYSQLHFGIFSPHLVTNFSIDIQKTFQLYTDELGLDAGLLRLFVFGSADGNIRMSSPVLQSGQNRFSAGTFFTEFKLDKVFEPSAATGKVKILVGNAEITKLNFQSLPFPLDGIKISKLLFNANLDKGNLKLNQAEINADVFRISAAGTVRIMKNIQNSQLNLEICFMPINGAESKESNLYGFYAAAGGDPNGRMCFFIRGTGGSPSFQKKESSDSA